MRISAIDLFCGAGGLTRGLLDSGIDVIAGYDIDPSCQYPYTKNNKSSFYLKNVNDLSYSDLPSKFTSSDIRIIAGCAPCQPFSKYNQSKPRDERWSLLYSFRDIVLSVLPEIVTMENVPELVKHSVYDDFVNALHKVGYNVSSQIVSCDKFSIPQKRERLVLLASKFGIIQLPKMDNQLKTVRDAISHLPVIQAGVVCREDPLHTSSKLSEKNLQRIIASKQGGSWKDWPEQLVCECHKKQTGQSYQSVYGRMEWDKPSPTITTQCINYGSGRFGHPTQNRAISLREAAILQTFPESYKFFDLDSDIIPSRKTLSRLIGNAVPVKLGEVIGKAINFHLAKQDKMIF